MRTRVGVLGLGSDWEHRHAPALRALADRFEVRAVCDPVGHLAREAAREFGAVVVDGYHSLCSREDVDAVLLFSPGWFGPLPLLAACAAGKAAYCGSDLCFQLEEASIIRRRVEASGIVFMAELHRRHAPSTLRLKELIATGLGSPQLLFCHHRMQTNGLPGGARGFTPQDRFKRELLDLVDWCCYIMGRRPTWVSGVVHRRQANQGQEDYEMLSLDFSDRERPGTGPVAQISSGRYIPERWQEAASYRPMAELQVSCESGIAFVDLPSTVVWFDEAGRHLETLDSERPVGERQLSEFHRAVTNQACTKSDLDDVYTALLIVHEAARGFREGRRIELS
ncbi:MAG TPA: gfo/Idh/MocA family oxidoreductase [Planctomycetaceae bacterium]|nr:gfo/Idh/MocA family oxidoreductase [Planctomycetaceae bacterium]